MVCMSWDQIPCKHILNSNAPTMKQPDLGLYYLQGVGSKTWPAKFLWWRGSVFFFPRLNPLALVPLGLGPENLAKHNFKSTVSQLAQLNFLELRFSSKHANICKPQVKTNKKQRWKTHKWTWVKHFLGNDGSRHSLEFFMVCTNILIILCRVALPTITNPQIQEGVRALLHVFWVCALKAIKRPEWSELSFLVCC